MYGLSKDKLKKDHVLILNRIFISLKKALNYKLFAIWFKAFQVKYFKSLKAEKKWCAYIYTKLII